MPPKLKNKKIGDELKKALNRELSEKERGEIYANLAILYMRTIIEINRRYSKLLDSAIAILKEFNRS